MDEISQMSVSILFKTNDTENTGLEFVNATADDTFNYRPNPNVSFISPLQHITRYV